MSSFSKKERLHALIEHYSNGNKAQFANKIGITPQGLSTWIKRDSFDIELIYSKCEYLSSRWLLTGEGPMLEKDTSRTQEATQTKPKVTRSTPTSAATESVLLSLIREKDETIRQQAIEIGKLTEQLRSLKSQD